MAAGGSSARRAAAKACKRIAASSKVSCAIRSAERLIAAVRHRVASVYSLMTRWLAAVGLGILAEDRRRLRDHARLGLGAESALQAADLKAHDRIRGLPPGAEHRVGRLLDKADPDTGADLRCVDEASQAKQGRSAQQRPGRELQP